MPAINLSSSGQSTLIQLLRLGPNTSTNKEPAETSKKTSVFGPGEKTGVRYYAKGYSTLYPTATILLLSDGQESLEDTLEELIEEDEKPSLLDEVCLRGQDHRDERVLVHCFGNVGVARFCELLRAFKVRKMERLGIRAIVFDDEPGMMLPGLHEICRQPFLLLVLIWASLVRIMDWMTMLWHGGRLHEEMWKNLNEDELMASDTRKCYVCPGEDVMFTWNSSDAGGDCAERKETEIKRQSIGRSGKWSSNQERYWLGIESVWEGK
ncbi:hypothetical protein CKM354_001150900 [Cercospora kikuchii]|uniref:Uncharacterized protein n=1 Tax=Cercospora kikuchii TaxID=84275 RepID=A0A9P3FL25_9PEZI|nr:uncharacterized protein CKM354_001150900 [Cercospora kikuchii]GIZ48449.1 hypothetical protein CKM354_001150900 [Cercospora kikuchii]